MNKRYAAYPYIVWIIGFTLIPLLIIFWFAFTDRTGAFTWDNILAIYRTRNFKPLYLAVLLSLVSTVICLLLAYPLAGILSKMKWRNHNPVIFLFILPMWMNFLLRTLAWQTILEKKGIINFLLTSFGAEPVKLINTPTAIVIGMVYNFLPFMVLPIYNAMCKIDPDIIHAARDLGAEKWHIFFKITLPLTKPGIISAITMVFVPALTTFAISDILGGGKVYLIGNVIEQEFKQGNNWHVGSGLSVILLLFVLISMALMKKYDSDHPVNGGRQP